MFGLIYSSFVTALEFHCEFTVTSWSVVKNAYTCVPTINTSGSKTELDSVIGAHEFQKSNSDVEFLFVYKQTVERMPKGIENFFPNIKVIEINTANLSSISADDLKPFPDLLMFASFNNKLLSVDGDLFKFTPKVRWATFHKSAVEHVGTDLFAPLKDLVYVNFEGNTCIDSMAKTPEEIKKLREELALKCAMENAEDLQKINDEL